MKYPHQPKVDHLQSSTCQWAISIIAGIITPLQEGLNVHHNYVGEKKSMHITTPSAEMGLQILSY